jgi:hypothetical protein
MSNIAVGSLSFRSGHVYILGLALIAIACRIIYAIRKPCVHVVPSTLQDLRPHMRSKVTTIAQIEQLKLKEDARVADAAKAAELVSDDDEETAERSAVPRARSHLPDLLGEEDVEGKKKNLKVLKKQHGTPARSPPTAVPLDASTPPQATKGAMLMTSSCSKDAASQINNEFILWGFSQKVQLAGARALVESSMAL